MLQVGGGGETSVSPHILRKGLKVQVGGHRRLSRSCRPQTCMAKCGCLERRAVTWQRPSALLPCSSHNVTAWAGRAALSLLSSLFPLASSCQPVNPTVPGADPLAVIHPCSYRADLKGGFQFYLQDAYSLYHETFANFLIYFLFRFLTVFSISGCCQCMGTVLFRR